MAHLGQKKPAMMPMTLAQARSAIARPVGLMRVAEAAAIAGVSVETLNRRIRVGQLPAWGRPRRVCLDHVLQPFMPRAESSVGCSSE
jgi:hypothetical protein